MADVLELPVVSGAGGGGFTQDETAETLTALEGIVLDNSGVYRIIGGNPKKCMSETDIFTSNNHSTINWTRVLGGGSLAIVGDGGTEYLGGWKVGTGNTAGDYITFLKGSTQFTGNMGIIACEFGFNVADWGTPNTDDMAMQLGFKDGSTLAHVTNGAAFWFNFTDSTTHWVVQCAESSTRTRVTTSTAVETGYHLFRVEIDHIKATPEVRFYIDDVLAETLTTNVPTNGVFCPRIITKKTTGTTIYYYNMDWFHSDVIFDADRY